MEHYFTNGCLLAFSFLVTLVILIGNLMENGQKEKCAVNFQKLLTLDLIYGAMNTCEEFYQYLGGTRDDFLFVIMDICLALGYYGGLFMLARFLVIYISMYREVPKWWLRITGILLCVAASVWFHYLFFVEGPNPGQEIPMLYHLSDMVVYLYAVFILFLLLYYRKSISIMEWLTMNSFIILPAVASLARRLFPNFVLVQLSTTLSILLMNNFLHMKQAQRLQEQEKELMEKQVQLMVSQIRPHFIFNVLNTIYILCETEPLKAQEAIDHFSRYLRLNLDNLTGKETMIPVLSELKHVHHYLKLEKMRYGDDLTIRTDIAASSFWVPSLTIQPVVENAVKHGIHTRSSGGVIEISTKETANYYEVCVRDNGKGFDPSGEKDDEKQHIGLKNVRERLAVLCEGRLLVESKIGEGTLVRMRLPKNRKTENIQKKKRQ